MRAHKALRQTLLLVAAQLFLVTPSSGVEMPRFLKELIAPRDGAGSTAPQTEESGGAPSPGSPSDADSGSDAGGLSDAPSASSRPSEASKLRLQEVKRGATRASVVLDKHCPQIVQPFRLTDNVGSVGAFTLQEGARRLGNLIPNLGTSRQKPSAAARNIDLAGPAKAAAKQMNWLPMRAEVLYGERLHAEETDILERDSRLGRKFYPIADRLLKDVLGSIDEEHEYEFKMYILKSSMRNALARPGGFIYVDQGLVEHTVHHPKAYFAVAHEVAHVLQRHETKELQSMIIDSIATKNDLVNVMSSVRGDPAVILQHVKIQKNLFTQHHIDQELQSDSCAARMLSRVFPDMQQLAASLQAFLKDLPKSVEKAPQRASSQAERAAEDMQAIVDDPIKRHPTTQQRRDNLMAIYNDIARSKR